MFVYFRHDCLEKVAGIDVFGAVHLPSIKQRIFNCNIQTLLFMLCRLVVLFRRENILSFERVRELIPRILMQIYPVA